MELSIDQFKAIQELKSEIREECIEIKTRNIPSNNVEFVEIFINPHETHRRFKIKVNGYTHDIKVDGHDARDSIAQIAAALTEHLMEDIHKAEYEMGGRQA